MPKIIENPPTTEVIDVLETKENLSAETSFVIAVTNVSQEKRKLMLDPEIQGKQRSNYINETIKDLVREDEELMSSFDPMGEYYRDLLEDFYSSDRSKTLKQKASRSLSLLKMRIKGIKDPQKVIEQIKQVSNIHTFHSVEHNDDNETRIKSLNYSLITRPNFLEVLSRLDDPVKTIARLNKLGIDITPYANFNQDGLLDVLNDISKIDDGHFNQAVSDLNNIWWLDSIGLINYDGEDVINSDFLMRVEVAKNGGFTKDQEKFVNYAQRLFLLAAIQPKLSFILAEDGAIEQDALIIEEHAFSKRDEENLDRHSFRDDFFALDRKFVVAEMIKSGMHLSANNNIVSRSTMYDKQVQNELRSEIDLAHDKMLDPMYISMRAFLELQNISDIAIVDSAVDLVLKTRDHISSMSHDAKVDAILNLVNPDVSVSDNIKSFSMISEWNTFLNNFIEHRNESTPQSKDSDTVKRLLINCFLYDGNGRANMFILKVLSFKSIPIHSLLTDNLLNTMDSQKKSMFRLISLLDEKHTDAYLQSFLAHNEENLPYLLDSNGKITPKFCHKFMKFDYESNGANNNSVIYLKPLLSEAQDNFTGKEADFWMILSSFEDGALYYGSYDKFMQLPQVAIDIIKTNLVPTGNRFLSLFTHKYKEVQSIIMESEGVASPPYALLELIFSTCSVSYLESLFPMADFGTIFADAMSELSQKDQDKWKTIFFTKSDDQLLLYSEYDEIPAHLISPDNIATENFFDFWIELHEGSLGQLSAQEEIVNMLKRDSTMDSFSDLNKAFWLLYFKVDNSIFRKKILSIKKDINLRNHEEVMQFINYLNNLDISDNPELFQIVTQHLDYLSQLDSQTFIKASSTLESLNNDNTMDDAYLFKIVLENFEYLVEIDEDSLKTYMYLAKKITSSPSTEIARIKDELITELLKVDDPESVFASIEDIFIRNNLPLVGKIFKIFQILNPEEKIAKTIKDQPYISPVIIKQSYRRKMHTFYADLVKSHLRSSNRSLIKYLKSVKIASELLFEHNSGVALSVEQQNFLAHFLNKVGVLIDNSSLDEADVAEATSEDDLNSIISKYASQLGVVSPDQISDRLARMFLYPAGIHSVDEALMYASSRREKADQRNRSYATKIEDGGFRLEKGDLFKGLIKKSDFATGKGYDYLQNILQNGSTAGDFLGASASTDSTAYDTDVTIFTDNDLQIPTGDLLRGVGEGVKYVSQGDGSKIEIGKKNISFDYGSLFVVIKNRGQFYRSDEGEKSSGREDYELFHTGVVDIDDKKRHFGVRTGLPSEEFDSFLVKDDLIGEEKMMRKIKFLIAQQGQYIPILDFDGNQLFPIEEYEEYRKVFSGVEEFFGASLNIDTQYPVDKEQEIDELLVDIQQGKEVVDSCDMDIKRQISEVLAENGINLLADHEDSLLGAKLHDIGSTGRRTNAPHDYDFDYALVLDAVDAQKSSKVYEKLLSNFDYEGLIPSSSSDRHLQLRMAGVLIQGKRVDIDIGITTKKEADIFASHDAVKAKLDSVRHDFGEEQYNRVIASIIIAKKLLKEGGAYKKGIYQDGGWGGIGTEFWILQHGGNLSHAMQAVWDNAHTSETRVELEVFKRNYHIYDAGTNIKSNRKFEDFVEHLTDDGYKALLDVVGRYLGK